MSANIEIAASVCSDELSSSDTETDLQPPETTEQLELSSGTRMTVPSVHFRYNEKNILCVEDISSTIDPNNQVNNREVTLVPLSVALLDMKRCRLGGPDQSRCLDRAREMDPNVFTQLLWQACQRVKSLAPLMLLQDAIEDDQIMELVCLMLGMLLGEACSWADQSIGILSDVQPMGDIIATKLRDSYGAQHYLKFLDLPNGRINPHDLFFFNQTIFRNVLDPEVLSAYACAHMTSNVWRVSGLVCGSEGGLWFAPESSKSDDKETGCDEESEDDNSSYISE